MPVFKLHLIAASFILLSSCKSYLSREDYTRPSHNLKKGEYTLALKNMPAGEEDFFITTLEKTYVKLLSGEPDIDKLQKYAADIRTRLRFKISRELKSFFYLETPEGYYASEHEIIWMHILLSWGYSMRKEYEKARVEAKEISNLLRIDWSSDGRFDDPFLRVILSGLWMMCGDWEEAQVHFRAASVLDPSLKWARALGGMDKAPKNLFMVLGGPGPEPEWNPEWKINPFRGFRGIVFKSQGLKSTLTAGDSKNRKIEVHVTPDSSGWYVRHFIRDNAIHELIEDSRYSQKAVSSVAKGVAISIAGIVGGAAIAATGIGLGVGLIVLTTKISTSADPSGLIAGGIILIVGGPYLGARFGVHYLKKGDEEINKGIDPSNLYRFVRFLPEYAWVGWSTDEISYPITFTVNGKPVLTYNKNDLQAKYLNNLIFGFYPDPNWKFIQKKVIFKPVKPDDFNNN